MDRRRSIPDQVNRPSPGGLRQIDSLLQRVPRQGWNWLVPIIYLAAVMPQLWTHALWRDEAQAWLICRASGNLPELLANLRYEGHPPLYYLLLWPFARLTDNPEWMKLLTGLLATGFVVVASRLRGLPRLEQVLLLAGFLPVIGYSTISRSYILGAFLLLVELALGAWVGIGVSGTRKVGGLAS